MAEMVGLISGTITLASLFKVCVEAFDVIQAVRHQEVEYRKLVLRLNIEKCRLYTWGQAMGLTNSGNEEPRPIDIAPFQNLVRDTLEIIIQTFHDSHKIQERYGCRSVPDSSGAHTLLTSSGSPNTTDLLALSFGNFRIRAAPDESVGLIGKARWAVQDRKKFQALIVEIRSLIDGLQQVTEPLISAHRQESAMKNAILTITDAETLNMVAEVCTRDHPRIADAASSRAETLSNPYVDNDAIVTWARHIDQSADDDLTMAQIEGMGVAELKHLLTQMIAQEGGRDYLQAAMQGNFNAMRMAEESLHRRNVAVAANRAALTADRKPQDAPAMKVLTVITLIFLPATFISTLFATDFMKLK